MELSNFPWVPPSSLGKISLGTWKWRLSKLSWNRILFFTRSFKNCLRRLYATRNNLGAFMIWIERYHNGKLSWKFRIDNSIKKFQKLPRVLILLILLMDNITCTKCVAFLAKSRVQCLSCLKPKPFGSTINVMPVIWVLLGIIVSEMLCITDYIGN